MKAAKNPVSQQQQVQAHQRSKSHHESSQQQTRERENNQEINSHQDQNNQVLYQQIVNEEKKIFGKKNQPRNVEPSMFDMLKWEEKETQGQQKCDFKSNNLPSTEVEQYKTLINKSASHFQTEQRDNYRQFYHDKDQNVLLPEVEPEVLLKLKSNQDQKGRSAVSQENRQTNGQTKQQTEVPTHPTRGSKSNYQRDYGVLNVKNEAELVGIVEKNHLAGQKQSQLLLEQAQKQKRALTQTNQLYQEEEIPQYIQNNHDYDEENNENVDENKNQTNKSVKIKQFKSIDTKNVKSKLIKYKPQAQKLDPQYQQERISRRTDRIKNMEVTTRWLPNSSFTTYFGKPAFENYGRGNVNPSNGGCVYGQYMLSHNVNPHRGTHQPQFIQSYNNALNFGERLPESEPQPPRNVNEDFRLSQNQVQELKNRNPLTATVNPRENLHIKKPDLINSLRFASNENSPVNAAKNDEEKRKRILQELKELKQGTKAHTGTATTHQNFTQVSEAAKPQQQLQRPQSAHPSRAPANQNTTAAQKVQPSVQDNLNSEDEYENLLQEQANQEWAADLPRKKFIEELNKKKAKKNRLALKVTEVIPQVPAAPISGEIAGITSQKKNTITQKGLPHQTEFTTQQINLSNVPSESQNELKEKLQNPKLYKNAPSGFTRHIPYAGKISEACDDIKSVFQYNNIEVEDF